MKKLLLVVLLVGSIQYTYASVRVTGVGSTEQEARHDAFRQAIEQEISSIVFSRREYRKGNTVRNDVLVHSAGYVTKYKVIDRYESSQGITLVLDVTVNRSRLADKLLVQMPEAEMLDGYNVEAARRTRLQGRDSWNSIYNAVLDDFPSRAFDITQRPSITSIGPKDSVIITIPLIITWNLYYVRSFEELITKISDGKDNLFDRNYYVGRIKFYGHSNKAYIFKDKEKVYQLRRGLVNNKTPYILVQIVSDNILIKKCVKINGGNILYMFSDSGDMRIYSKNVSKANVSIQVDNFVEDIYHIETYMLPYEQCMYESNIREMYAGT